MTGRPPTDTHIVAKTLIFNDQGNLLVLKRSEDDEHRPGGWDFPGGKVELGEAVSDGAVREAYEEAGIRLNPETIRLSFASAKTNYRKKLNRNVNIVWLGYTTGLPDGSEITLSHEHSDYKWMTLDEFINTTTHPAHHELISYLRQNRIAADLWEK